MRRDFVPLTAHVIRRKPWARGKKKASKRKEMQPAKVEFINEEEDGEAGEEGVLQ